MPWRDRLSSAWAGFGLASKSRRELAVLTALGRAGIGCPEPLAAGEDGGRAFLLLGAIEDGQDLRDFLRQHAGRPAGRRAVARQLGAELARLHAAGFDQPDLHAKHVLVSRVAATGEPCLHFLDWQRSRCHDRLAWPRRWRDLAALDATLADDLADLRDRLACLHSYLRHSRGASAHRVPRLAPAARAVRAHATSLLRVRRIREQRQPPLPAGTQNLVWMDGEALCMTRQFRDAVGRQPPAYLLQAGEVPLGQVRQGRVPIPGPGWATLMRRSARRPLPWLWARLRGRRLVSPELEQAGTLFLLERYGLRAPTLLAVGQRQARPWQLHSFLLTQPVPHTVGLLTWLARPGGPRRVILQETGMVLRRLHEAGCYLTSGSAPAIDGLLQVQATGAAERIVLGSTSWLLRRRPHAGLARKDVKRLLQAFGARASQTESLRFLLAYLGRPRRTPALKRLLSRVLPPRGILQPEALS